jgi:ParB family chromosome partitioning protein
VIDNNKWKSPLDLMLENDQPEEKITSYIKKFNDSQLNHFSHDQITIWRYKDRNITNISDIKPLVNSIQNEGQQQPCIVRKDKKDGFYELIIGYRRYAACKILNIPITCIVSRLTDKEAALCQIAENKYRKDISDFEKGDNYTNLLNSGILKKDDLIKTLNISKQSLDRYLSFNKIPSSIIQSITDIHSISARTAEEILRLSRLGDIYIKKLESIGDDISKKNLGAYSITKTINNLLGIASNSEKPTYSQDEKLLFTIINKKNGAVIIKFNKEITSAINLKNIENILYDELNNTYK